MKLKLILSMLIGMACHGLADNPTPITFRSTEVRVILLELYTSEGCSSCPPAEAWLSGATNSPGLWRSFVPVAFHVDYWDYLGWRDGTGSPDFSNRQRGYAQAWRSGTIYTPGFVLNGKEWRNWGGDINRLTVPPIKSGVLEISSSDTNRWHARFSPVNKSSARLEVHVALLANSFISNVKAGENRGRQLAHDFAALSLQHAALTAKDGEWQGELVVRVNLDRQKRKLAIAAWVTPVNVQEPIQAVGGWLPGAEKP